MSIDQAAGITQPQTTPPPALDMPAQQVDLFVPSLFLSASAIILGFIEPIYIHFETRWVETTLIILAGLLPLWWGTLSRKLPILYAGTAILLAGITLETMTQPTQLSVPLVAVWPLRILLVMLVGCSWGFLMQPARWLTRALIAIAVPTLLVLSLWGGPAVGAALFGWNVYVPITNFMPFWVAVDTQGTVYATDASGELIWVFDKSGSPQGTIRPRRAPKTAATPGPGILPNGLDEELNLSNVSLLPTATPLPINAPLRYESDFCGIATDPQDNLYILDTTDLTGYKLLRFDRGGQMTARWPAPPTYRTTKGCLAADAGHIYLSSRTGEVYTLDHEAKVIHTSVVPYQPLGIALDGKGKLFVTGPSALNSIEISSGTVVTLTVPPSPSQLQIPFQSIVVNQAGEVLLADWGSNQIMRLNPDTGKFVGEIGGPGFWPGQFQGLGGFAQDKEGRLYVADWQHRVIQRFTADGKIDGLWWAARAVPEGQQEPEAER